MKKRFYRPWFLFMILSHLNLSMNGILNTAQDDWMTTNWPIWIGGFSQEFQRNGILLSCWHHTPFGMEESSQLFERKGIACFTKHGKKASTPSHGFVEDRGEWREKKRLAGHQNMSVAYTCSFSDQQFGGSNMSVAYTRNFVWWLSTHGTHINLGSYV